MLRSGLGSCLVVVLAACGSAGQAASSSGGDASARALPDSGVSVGAADAATGADPEDAGDASTTPPGSSAEAGDPVASACPAAPQWSPGDSQTIAITVDGGARSYDVYVGQNVKPGTAVPLLVNMHGLTNTPAIQAQFSQMNPVADANGFVVVYPAGLGASFNAGACCGTSSATGVDDVGFVRAIVADAEAKICIDPKRVYETGFSNGGMMAYELACNAADLFAAVAPTEGENVTDTPCNPSRPVPLAAFQYLADPVVTAAAAQQSVEAWATTDGCTDPSPTTATVSGFSCDEWSACGAGTNVWYCTMPGGTHYPPVGSAPVIWSFLSRFAMP
jgi:polyhydroxybutyrate depolymerase